MTVLAWVFGNAVAGLISSFVILKIDKGRKEAQEEIQQLEKQNRELRECLNRDVNHIRGLQATNNDLVNRLRIAEGKYEPDSVKYANILCKYVILKRAVEKKTGLSAEEYIGSTQTRDGTTDNNHYETNYFPLGAMPVYPFNPFVVVKR